MTPSRTSRRLILGIVGAIFAIPIVGMIEYTLRGGIGGGYTADRWVRVFTGGLDNSYRVMWQAIGNSILLSVLTMLIVLVLLVPTMVLVHLRFRRLQPVLEFVCILPISIPAIAIVVGLAPVYSVVSRIFGSGAWTLCFAYGVLVLPFAYRAIQGNLTGVDVRTLAEAARSLGAGWGTVIARILLPNLRRGLLAASVIAGAVVLGEFTVASLLNRNNLQTALLVIQASDPFIAIIFTLLALAFAFALLLILGRAGATTRRRK